MKGSREKNLKSLLIGLSLTSVILPQSDTDRKPITALLRNVFSKKERKRFIERNNCTLRETGREKNHEKVRDREIERGREREREGREKERESVCVCEIKRKIKSYWAR